MAGTISVLPYTYSDDTGFTNEGNLLNSNGEAYGAVANGETDWITLYYNLGAANLTASNGFAVLISGASISLDAKSNRWNTSMYNTRPRIDWIKYYSYINGVISDTQRSLNWYGAQTAGTDWKAYSTSDTSGVPFIPTNSNKYFQRIELRVGVNKYKGALADQVSLRNVRLTLSYRLLFLTYYRLQAMQNWQTFYTIEGSSHTTPIPTQAGYTFLGWYTALDGGSYVCGGGVSYSPTSAQSLYPHWQLIQHAITTSCSAGGSITPTQQVSPGGSTTIYITPNSGYHISDVTVDGVSVGAVSSYTFSNVTAGHTVYAAFAVNITVNTVSDRAKISDESGFTKCVVTFVATAQYTQYEIRATKAGSSYGRGIGILLASAVSTTPANTSRTHDVYWDDLTLGDGDYRISVYCKTADGYWST